MHAEYIDDFVPYVVASKTAAGAPAGAGCYCSV
jgi:hypothetical protein